MVYYYLGYFYHQLKNEPQALKNFQEAEKADSYLCFPNRLEAIRVLQLASKVNPGDAKAPYYLGNLFYDKRQYEEAIALWELSASLDANFPTVFRNLGIAFFNKRNDKQKALDCYEKAFNLDKTDARVLMELGQLYKRLNRQPQERLAFLEENLPLVKQRDDVYLELAALHNFLGEYEKAFQLIMNRKFHPWEGGEGKVSGQYVYSLIEMAKRNILEKNFSEAVKKLEQAQVYPYNLGEGKLFGARENDIFYWLGVAFEELKQENIARDWFTKATAGLSEPAAAMFYNDQQPDKIFYQGLAWQKLGEREKAAGIFQKLVDYADSHEGDAVKIDYFAVSLPDLLIFEDDLNTRNKIHCYFMKGLGCLGLGREEDAKHAFSRVLSLDAEHFGAQTHLRFNVFK